MKLTPQRMVIFAAVLRANDHPDTEAVDTAVRKQIPTVSLDTIDRLRWRLYDWGVVPGLVWRAGGAPRRSAGADIPPAAGPGPP